METKQGRGVGSSVQTAEVDDLAITTAKLAAGAVTTAKLDASAVTNGVVSATAAIAYSKLNLASSIVNADISASAAIALTKLSTAGFSANQVIAYDGNNFAATNPQGVWTYVGAANLTGGAADTLEVSGISPTFQNYKVIALFESATINVNIRFNNDTGNNYAYGLLENATYSSSGTSSVIAATSNIGGGVWVGLEMIVTKLAASHAVVNGLAYTETTSYKFGGKWTNVTDLISRITFLNTHTGDYGDDSKMVVFGRNF